MTHQAAIRATLEKELARLRSRAGRIDDHRHNRGREVPQDSEDLATFREDDEVVEALDETTRAELARIELTLRRMDEGSWGTCALCKQAIAAERLAAMPSHALCLACASEQENSSS